MISLVNYSNRFVIGEEKLLIVSSNGQHLFIVIIDKAHCLGTRILICICLVMEGRQCCLSSYSRLAQTVAGWQAACEDLQNF